MIFIILPFVAICTSLLTFFSGFGLGTILTPVFAIFFPVEIAVGLTAIVHFLNGIFKLILVGRFAVFKIVIRFGLPAVVSAIIGAWALTQVSYFSPISSYILGGKIIHITPVKLTLAILIFGFTLFELIPRLRDLEIDAKYLPLGGLVSGFFGGLSGHQGALRSAFLAKSGLTKEQFIATGTLISSLIDVARISIYLKNMNSDEIVNNVPLLTVTVFAAFIGAYMGNKLLKKVTMHGVQIVVSFSLFLLSIALGTGLI